ncbi:MAG: hypothetical protein QM775_29995 [Pirellulales bacterium]
MNRSPFWRRSTDGRFTIVEHQGLVTLHDSVTGMSYDLLKLEGLDHGQVAQVDELSPRNGKCC